MNYIPSLLLIFISVEVTSFSSDDKINEKLEPEFWFQILENR